ncbi:hypothetical protein AB4K20DRAFT_1870865 [Rhizopus microsporus]
MKASKDAVNERLVNMKQQLSDIIVLIKQLPMTTIINSYPMLKISNLMMLILIKLLILTEDDLMRLIFVYIEPMFLKLGKPLKVHALDIAYVSCANQLRSKLQSVKKSKANIISEKLYTLSGK